MNRSPTQRWGWRLLIGLSVLLTLNGVTLYLVIADTHVEQTIGVLLAGFGLLSTTATLEGQRNTTARAWRSGWVLVVTLGAIGLHAIRGGRGDLVGLYLGLAVLAFVGLLLTRPGTQP